MDRILTRNRIRKVSGGGGGAKALTFSIPVRVCELKEREGYCETRLIQVFVFMLRQWITHVSGNFLGLFNAALILTQQVVQRVEGSE